MESKDKSLAFVMRHYDYSGEVKKADREELIDLVNTLGKKINRRFNTLENKGRGLKESAYRYAQTELNQTSPRYNIRKSYLKNLSDEELKDLGLSISKKLSSFSSTLSGLKVIEDKRVSNAIYSLEDTFGVEINEKDFKYFLTHGGSELLNSKYLDSTQVIEDWLEYTKKGVSKTQFLKTFKDFMSKNKKGKVDLGKIHKEFNTIVKNKQTKLKKNKKSTNVGKVYKRKKK